MGAQSQPGSTGTFVVEEGTVITVPPSIMPFAVPAHAREAHPATPVTVRFLGPDNLRCWARVD